MDFATSMFTRCVLAPVEPHIPRYVTPNAITYSRIVAAGLIWPAYVLAGPWLCGALFVLASLSDGFDGYLARRRNLCSAHGARWDALADKILTASMAVLLLALVPLLDWNSVFLCCAGLFLRDLLIESFRGLGAQLGPTLRAAKWKTAFQMIALALLVFGEGYSALSWAGMIALFIALVLSFYSACRYIKRWG